MQARYVVWWMAAGFGCGGATPRQAPAPPVSPVAAVAPDTAKPAADVPPAPPAPAPLNERVIAPLDGAPACTLRDEGWYGELSFAGDAAPFARVLAANTTLSLPQAGSGMFAQLEGSGIRIGAWAHAPTLHLARAVALSTVVYPQPGAEVDWEGLHRVGAVAISLDVSSALSEPTTARAEIACKDLSIEEAAYKLPASVPTPKQAAGRILKGEAALSTTAGGKPVAKVQASPTATLLIAGKRGAATHIVLEGPDFVVHGWIASSMLAEGVAPSMGQSMGLGGYGAKISRPNSENHGCVRDLPLFVEVAGQRAEVGVLLTGSPYPEVTEKVDAAGYVGVRPYGRQWLVLAAGARLVVRDADLARCHTP